MMARAEHAARSGGSALVRDMAKTLTCKASSREWDDREEFKLKTRKKDERWNGGSLHGKFHRAQGGTVAVCPAPDGRHNVPTARVKPIQDGSRAMPWVDIRNSRPLATFVRVVRLKVCSGLGQLSGLVGDVPSGIWATPRPLDLGRGGICRAEVSGESGRSVCLS